MGKNGPMADFPRICVLRVSRLSAAPGKGGGDRVWRFSQIGQAQLCINLTTHFRNSNVFHECFNCLAQNQPRTENILPLREF